MPQLRTLKLRLHGPFSAAWRDGSEIDLRSVKLQALLALLALSPNQKRTRAWLRDKLWSRSGSELGRASLRRGLSDLRRCFGEDFEQVFEVTNDWLRLRPGMVEIEGRPSDGELLEGIKVQETAFEMWLEAQRQRERQTSVTVLSDTGRDGPTERPETGDRITPSIAVIPFVALPTEGADALLGDVLAQEITRALSRSHLLTVISHLSSRSLASRSVGLEELREKLDVDYAVSGCVRLQGERIRIDADFIDARSGRICWTREFFAQLPDFFAGTDEVVAALSLEVGRAILASEVELATSKPLPDVPSHTLLMSGIALMHRQTLASFSKARTHVEEVIRRAPKHSMVHAWLGKWYILSVQQGWSTDLRKDARIASECTQRALDLDPDCAFSLAIDGFVQNNLMKRFDTALARFDDALERDPNNALAWLLKGTLHAFVDDGPNAVAFTDRARTLSPLDPHRYFFDSLSATARLANADYATALELAERSLRANRRHTSTLRVRTIALQRLGRAEEARTSVRELLKLEPTLTIQHYLHKHPAAEFRTGREWADALRAAGVPDS